MREDPTSGADLAAFARLACGLAGDNSRNKLRGVFCPSCGERVIGLLDEDLELELLRHLLTHEPGPARDRPYVWPAF